MVGPWKVVVVTPSGAAWDVGLMSGDELWRFGSHAQLPAGFRVVAVEADLENETRPRPDRPSS